MVTVSSGSGEALVHKSAGLFKFFWRAGAYFEDCMVLGFLALYAAQMGDTSVLYS